MDERVEKAIVEKIIDLCRENTAFHVVSNERIYRRVTGLQRFSGRQWISVEPYLKKIAARNEYEVNGIRYFLQPYQPTHRSRYNIRLRNDIVPLYLAGFTIHKR